MHEKRWRNRKYRRRRRGGQRKEQMRGRKRMRKSRRREDRGGGRTRKRTGRRKGGRRWEGQRGGQRKKKRTKRTIEGSHINGGGDDRSFKRKQMCRPRRDTHVDNRKEGEEKQETCCHHFFLRGSRVQRCVRPSTQTSSHIWPTCQKIFPTSQNAAFFGRSEDQNLLLFLPQVQS